jgi:N-acetyl-gamma-glutamyl-phosphate reductase
VNSHAKTSESSTQRVPGRAGDASPRVARVAVLGASGYSGQEFVRLALGHPGLRITALGSRDLAGQPGSALLAGSDPRSSSLPVIVDVEGLVDRHADGEFDTLVVCLPRGAWKELSRSAPSLAAAPSRILDLSADHRDGSASPAGGAPYVYGLTEAFRDAVRGATRLANPGCYPTAAALALLPAVEQGWLGGPVSVSALSGVSGAGRAAKLGTSFVELEGGAAMYKAGHEHGHALEMEHTLARLAARPIPVGFAPQIVPMSRGILLTAWTTLARAVSPQEAHALYAARFADEPFVRVLDPGAWPATREVRGSNRCDIGVTTLHGGSTLLATSAIDNLVKGASGQAMQNLNLMLGWNETTGLARDGSPW